MKNIEWMDRDNVIKEIEDMSIEFTKEDDPPLYRHWLVLGYGRRLDSKKTHSLIHDACKRHYGEEHPGNLLFYLLDEPLHKFPIRLLLAPPVTPGSIIIVSPYHYYATDLHDGPLTPDNIQTYRSKLIDFLGKDPGIDGAVIIGYLLFAKYRSVNRLFVPSLDSPAFRRLQ